MKNNPYYVLGIDTSNYTTSIAVLDEDYNLIADERIILDVPKGARGLRQSDAVFKHIQNIPIMSENIFKHIDRNRIKCVSVSNKPRPIKDSYMPAFVSGQAFAKTLSCALDCDYMTFSHQEGHIRAGCIDTTINVKEGIVVLHLSGGTTEMLLVKQDEGYDIEIIGGSQDISFGQLIDRVGVHIGLPFPAGKWLDRMAFDYSGPRTQFLKKICIKDTEINLSGIETQCIRSLENNIDQQALISELFYRISEALKQLIINIASKSKHTNILLVGGVSASECIKKYLTDGLRNTDNQVYFSKPQLSTDNAVGIAALAIDRIKSQV